MTSETDDSPSGIGTSHPLLVGMLASEAIIVAMLVLLEAWARFTLGDPLFIRSWWPGVLYLAGGVVVLFTSFVALNLLAQLGVALIAGLVPGHDNRG